MTVIWCNLIVLSVFGVFNSYLDLEMVEFTLHEVLVASISQVMIKSNAKSIRIVQDAKEIMSETLYGDSLRLQQVLADFLSVSVNFMPSGGQLTLAANMTKDQLGQSVHLVHVEFRYTFFVFIVLMSALTLTINFYKQTVLT